MNRTLTASLALTVAAIAVSSTACSPKPDPYPYELPPPVGTRVRMWQERQMSKADADRFVLYRSAWLANSPIELGPAGRKDLHRMAEELPIWPYPVVIAPDPDDPELNDMRREIVVRYLAENNIANADQRVVIAEPKAEGLEAESDVLNLGY